MSSSNCRLRSSYPKSPGNRTKSRSYPGFNLCLLQRYISRISRLVRFLSTEVPNFRTKLIPNLFRSDSLFNKTSFAPRVFTTRDEAYNRLKSALLFILSVLVRLLFIGNRQFLSAFLPSAGKDCSSSPGRHSSPKTEFPGSFGAARLVGTFHVPASLKCHRANINNRG